MTDPVTRGTKKLLLFGFFFPFENLLKETHLHGSYDLRLPVWNECFRSQQDRSCQEIIEQHLRGLSMGKLILGTGYWILGIGYWVLGSKFKVASYRTNYVVG